MITAPDPVSSLLSRPFTSDEATSLGLDYRTLLRENVARVSRGLYVPGDGEPSVRDRLRAHLAVSADAWASHRSAAAVQGLWLPESSSDHSLLHLSRPMDAPRVRRTGVVGHRVRVEDGEVEVLQDGLRVSSPSRTWLDLAHELGPASLVALGDQLIRSPRPEFEGREYPFATKGELVELLKAHPNMRGIVKARAALQSMRVGADSVPETLLRLSLLAYHFPEPELQIRLRPFDPLSPSGDLGYRVIQVVLQYDGAHHLSEEQRLRDLRRDAAFRSAGWVVVIVTADDLRNDFARVRAELRALWAKRAA